MPPKRQTRRWKRVKALSIRFAKPFGTWNFFHEPRLLAVQSRPTSTLTRQRLASDYLTPDRAMVASCL